MKSATAWIWFIPLFASPLACKDSTVGNALQTMRPLSDGGVVTRVGEQAIQASETAYTGENLKTLSDADVAALPTNARRLLLTRRMLRSLAIKDGLRTGLFDTADAYRFILPRFEKVLEDYYVYRKSDEASVRQRLLTMQDDKAAIEAFIQAEKLPVSVDDFSRATQATIERIISERRTAEQSRIFTELLQGQTIEVMP